LPGAEVQFVAERVGPCRTDTGSLVMMAEHSLADVSSCDVLVVPGGPAARALADREPVTRWVRAMHQSARWTTSVCTGSLILAGAGVLRGVNATCHWYRMDQLAALGAVPVHERVVFAGNIVTAAGVSAGIDMALALAARIAGDTVAQAIQLGIEYDPHPPFDAGSPGKAPPEVRALVEARYASASSRSGRPPR
jgi:putative intracellular protease/amidase